MTDSSTVLTTLLVGAHFRPPAKTVLAALPAGTPLLLEPESDNVYDEGAVRVLVEFDEVFDSIPEEAAENLEVALPGSGSSLDDLLNAEGPLHLGYCPAPNNKDLARRGGGLVSNRQIAEAIATGPGWRAELAFASDGHPLVRVYLGQQDSNEETGP